MPCPYCEERGRGVLPRISPDAIIDGRLYALIEGILMAKSASRGRKKIRTTVTLPKPVYEEARSLIASDAAPVDSMNGFFEAAITAYLKHFKRREIDGQFAAMATDPVYQREAAAISEEFSGSDWEAFEKRA
jgi:hypothetical protein